MKANEIMARNVLSVSPDTAVRDVARLMAERRISGVPVVDSDGKLVGIVSESDLLHRMETGTERRSHKWWFQLVGNADEMAREFAKSHGLTAEDVMSREVVVVEEDADLARVADLLDKRKRVPVVKDGRIVGMITRGDLVRALAEVAMAPVAVEGNDQTVSADVRERLRRAPWLNMTYASVIVTDGVAQLNGVVSSEDQHRALKLLVRETPGVNEVDDQLRVGKVGPGL